MRAVSEPDPGWLARDNEPDAGPWNTGLDGINQAEPVRGPADAQPVRDENGELIAGWRDPVTGEWL
jgi:hypothetical protein